jgi:hypothetical protein
MRCIIIKCHFLVHPAIVGPVHKSHLLGFLKAAQVIVDLLNLTVFKEVALMLLGVFITIMTFIININIVSMSIKVIGILNLIREIGLTLLIKCDILLQLNPCVDKVVNMHFELSPQLNTPGKHTILSEVVLISGQIPHYFHFVSFALHYVRFVLLYGFSHLFVVVVKCVHLQF